MTEELTIALTKAPALGRIQINVLEELGTYGPCTSDELMSHHGTPAQRDGIAKTLHGRGFVDRHLGPRAFTWTINKRGYAALKHYGRLPRMRRRAVR